MSPSPASHRWWRRPGAGGSKLVHRWGPAADAVRHYSVTAAADAGIPLHDRTSAGSVQSGEALQLRLTWSGTQCVVLRDTVDAYGSGQEIRDGTPVPGRDLAFRVVVQ